MHRFFSWENHGANFLCNVLTTPCGENPGPNEGAPKYVNVPVMFGQEALQTFNVGRLFQEKRVGIFNAAVGETAITVEGYEITLTPTAKEIISKAYDGSPLFVSFGVPPECSCAKCCSMLCACCSASCHCCAHCCSECEWITLDIPLPSKGIYYSTKDAEFRYGCCGTCVCGMCGPCAHYAHWKHINKVVVAPEHFIFKSKSAQM